MDSSVIKQARQKKYLLLQGDSKAVGPLIDAWSQECDQKGWPVIIIMQRGARSDLHYVLRNSAAKDWSESLRRDIEGFLVVELQSGTLESGSPVRQGAFGPLQGRIQGLELRQAIHIARRLALVTNNADEFERGEGSTNLRDDQVIYVGANADDLEYVAEYLRSIGASEPDPVPNGAT